MINKKLMTLIKKQVQKEKEICILHKPTKEEKEYLLKKFNIYTEKVIRFYPSMFIEGLEVEFEFCKYYLK